MSNRRRKKQPSMIGWILLVFVVSMSFMMIREHFSQPKISFQEQFIETLNANMTPHPTFKSVVYAQAILESNWGQSELSTEANNLFGIKGDYHGKSYTVTTTEFEDGAFASMEDTFRRYPDYRTSIADHAELMYLSRYDGVREARTYREAAQALQDGGYATDPNYASKLIEIIETYRLFEYDHAQ
ncbi:glycoside hydrolase family 73 protein [Erysipelothrix aquatica]|uniref:glycoside hydrolase family 73 protein n=1 Tax=Erysipelothrix aquatica TaxID=2683714 RepID=UPI00135787ED|nr:glycoside hydrolase family 73 protein [Erysipelothrix aquatica]